MQNTNLHRRGGRLVIHCHALTVSANFGGDQKFPDKVSCRFSALPAERDFFFLPFVVYPYMLFLSPYKLPNDRENDGKLRDKLPVGNF